MGRGQDLRLFSHGKCGLRDRAAGTTRYVHTRPVTYKHPPLASPLFSSGCDTGRPLQRASADSRSSSTERHRRGVGSLPPPPSHSARLHRSMLRRWPALLAPGQLVGLAQPIHRAVERYERLLGVPVRPSRGRWFRPVLEALVRALGQVDIQAELPPQGRA